MHSTTSPGNLKKSAAGLIYSKFLAALCMVGKPHSRETERWQPFNETKSSLLLCDNR